jgi:hypothetical protein
LGHGGAAPYIFCPGRGVVFVLVVGSFWRRRRLSAAALESSERHARASAE